jgi:hypothetical protein
MSNRDDRDWAGEIRAAIYQCHGLNAWHLALDSDRAELVAYVEQTTGGFKLEPVTGWEPEDLHAHASRHLVTLCGWPIANIEHQTWCHRVLLRWHSAGRSYIDIHLLELLETALGPSRIQDDGSFAWAMVGHHTRPVVRTVRPYPGPWDSDHFTIGEPTP